MSLKPNASCEDRFCRQRQGEFALKPKVEKVEEQVKEKPLHEDNEWGICLVDETVQKEKEKCKIIAPGSTQTYELPTQDDDSEQVTIDVGAKSLEELMLRMKAI